MFYGTNNLTLDGKHRMAVPAKYRERIKDLCGNNMVVAPAAPLVSADKGLVVSEYLWLYTADQWAVVAQQVMGLSATVPANRRMQQMFLGGAEEVSVDSTGRLLLPARLREFAKIEKNVALVALGNKFEIWAEDAFVAHQNLDNDSLVSTEQVVEQLNQLVL